MKYQVRALRLDTVTSIEVEAHDEVDARAQVQALALQPLSVRAASAASALRPFAGAAHFSLTLFSQELLALLEGGLSIVESITALCEKETRPATKALFERIARGLAEGKSFSACLAALSETFTPLYAGMVHSAEKTSGLAAALRRYIDYQSRVDAVRARIISASIYPAILLVVGSAVIAFLGTYVVPKFATVYHGTGRPLPLLSGWLLAWGTFAAAHARQLGVALLLLLAGAVAALRALRGKGALARALRLLPFLAERVRIYELTRLYLTLGMLLEGGLPVTPALALARGVVAPHRHAALDAAIRDISTGESVSDAFERAGLTTPVAQRFMRVGEKSGRLGEMLNRSAGYYDAEMSRWLERFTRAFEPLLMTAIGLIVGLIVVLLYMPIFDLAGSFQQ